MPTANQILEQDLRQLIKTLRADRDELAVKVLRYEGALKNIDNESKYMGSTREQLGQMARRALERS